MSTLNFLEASSGSALTKRLYKNDNGSLVKESYPQVKNYLIQHGQHAPELIETWDYQFRLERINLFDPTNRFINQFEDALEIAG